MRIIDLLNKIANDEEVPEKIKYNDKIFIYDGFSYIYENKTFDEYNRLEEFIFYSSDLNDEVEIIEEDKKIEKLKLYTFASDNLVMLIEMLNDLNKEHVNKINEIIDYLEENK